MKDCTDCKHAFWETTKTNRLHPSGDGKCLWKYKDPIIPSSFYWIGRIAPQPLGGHISRHKELKEHCPYYSPK